MTRRCKTTRFWEKLDDEALLDMEFRELRLNLEQNLIADGIAQLNDELAQRGIRFRPHFWLGEEWFSPDGIPGISIPFYLAHPRLKKLESRQMYDVEGGTPSQLIQLLRHETGHAIMTAYQLSRSSRCRKVFGQFNKPYPTYYRPNSASRRYVLHLDWWYAQAHPAEDFAETFAVWLSPRSQWRKKYANWPALKKLEYMDELMCSLKKKTLKTSHRHKVSPVTQLKKTLREHYDEKKRHYGIDIPATYDEDLMRMFSPVPLPGKRQLAASFLKRITPKLSRACAHGTGEHPYVIAQMIKDMIVRCREMKLYVDHADETAYMEVAALVSVQVIHYLHKVKHRIAV